MVSNLGRKLEEGFKSAKQEGIKEGIKEGIQKGIQQGVMNTAKNLLKLGMDIELIKQATNLSDEEIINLQEEIEKEKN